MDNERRPPLGLRPRFVWIEERLDEVGAACDRYKIENKEIPDHWNDEIEWLVYERRRAILEFRRRLKE